MPLSGSWLNSWTNAPFAFWPPRLAIGDIQGFEQNNAERPRFPNVFFHSCLIKSGNIFSNVGEEIVRQVLW